MVSGVLVGVPSSQPFAANDISCRGGTAAPEKKCSLFPPGRRERIGHKYDCKRTCFDNELPCTAVSSIPFSLLQCRPREYQASGQWAGSRCRVSPLVIMTKFNLCVCPMQKFSSTCWGCPSFTFEAVGVFDPHAKNPAQHFKGSSAFDYGTRSSTRHLGDAQQHATHRTSSLALFCHVGCTERWRCL